MPTDAEEPDYVAAGPYRMAVTETLHSVAAFGAGMVPDASLRAVLAGVVFGPTATWVEHVATGRVLLAPTLRSDGRLIIEIGVALTSLPGAPAPDPVYWTAASVEHLGLEPDERALVFRQASAMHRLAVLDVPDVPPEVDLGGDVEDL